MGVDLQVFFGSAAQNGYTRYQANNSRVNYSGKKKNKNVGKSYGTLCRAEFPLLAKLFPILLSHSVFYLSTKY